MATVKKGEATTPHYSTATLSIDIIWFKAMGEMKAVNKAVKTGSHDNGRQTETLSPIHKQVLTFIRYHHRCLD